MTSLLDKKRMSDVVEGLLKKTQAKSNNNKKKKKRAKLMVAPQRVVRCAGARCGGCELAVPLAQAFDQVLFCSDCYDVVYGVEEDGSDAPEGLHWFVTHVDHGVIAGSSMPDVVRPTPPPLGPSLPCALGPSHAVAEAARHLARADAVLVMAGAGCSIDSNLPDFRGRGGWYSLGGGDGEELISMAHVDFHPGSPHLLTAWRLKIAMVQAFQRARPHRGYLDLVNALWGGEEGQASDDDGSSSSSSSSSSSPCSSSSSPSPSSSSSSSSGRLLAGPGRAFVMTSNIDGFFERAGVPSALLYETHGTVHRFQCTSVGTAAEAACPRSGEVWEIPTAERAALERRMAESSAAAKKAKLAEPANNDNHNRGVLLHGEVDGTEKENARGAEAAQPPQTTDGCASKHGGDHDSSSSSSSGGGGGGGAGNGCGAGDVCEQPMPLSESDLPRCGGCGALARPNVSHTTDSDEDICPQRKAGQRRRALAWIEACRAGTLPAATTDAHADAAAAAAAAAAANDTASANTESATATATAALDENASSAGGAAPSCHVDGGGGTRLVVLEVGCGLSEHSLRLDSEVVVARHREAGGEACLVRIDPGAPTVPQPWPQPNGGGGGGGDGGGSHIGVALGARDALVRIVAAAREEKRRMTTIMKKEQQQQLH